MKQNIHYACYDEILSEAHRAGVYHGLDLKPTPMVVEDHVNVLGMDYSLISPRPPDDLHHGGNTELETS